MLRVSTRTALLAGFAALLGGIACFSPHSGGAACPEGFVCEGVDAPRQGDGGGPSDAGPPGTPTIARVLTLTGVNDNELRVAAGDPCGLVTAGDLSRAATLREPTSDALPTPISQQGTPGEGELFMAGLEPDLSIRWRAGVFASSGAIEITDLTVSCGDSLALLVGDASTSSTITYGVDGGGTFSCGRTFVVAVDVASGAPRWAHCAGPNIKYKGVAVQGGRIAVTGKIGTEGAGDDGYVELLDDAGDPSGHTYTAGDAGDDEYAVIAAVPSGGFVTGGIYDGDPTTGDDGMIYVVNDDLTAGGRTVLGSIASASDDEVTAVGAAGDVVWVAGTLGGGGTLAWPSPTPTGYSADAFVGGASLPGAAPDVIAGFASTLDHVAIRAIDAQRSVTIAGEYRGDVIDDAGTIHPGGSGERPFFARLDPADVAITAWVPLTDDAATNGRVTSITRAGDTVWLGGWWTGSILLPDGATASASDQDGFLIEVTGL